MRRLQHILFVIGLLTASCGRDPSGELFPGFFNGGLPTAPAQGQGSISIVSKESFLVNSVGFSISPNHIVFDGSRLVIPVKGSLDAASQLTFLNLSTALASQSTSTTTATNIANVYSVTSPETGKAAFLWRDTGNCIGGDYTNCKFSTWSSSNGGALLSTITLSLTAMGCNDTDVRITYCSGAFYGACKNSSGNIRFFAFDSSGTLTSGVTTSIAANPKGLACYSGNLILARDGGGFSGVQFYKYSTAFTSISEDTTNTSSFPVNFQNVSSISTDGSNIFINSGTQSCSGGYCLYVSKTTLGALQ